MSKCNMGELEVSNVISRARRFGAGYSLCIPLYRQGRDLDHYLNLPPLNNCCERTAGASC